MRRLSGLDATFLYLETPNNHMHVAGVYVLEPGAFDGEAPYDRIKRLIANRLHLLPPFRRRLVEVPFGLTHPVWIEDPHFDLDFHVRHAAVAAPGGDRELAAFAGAVMGRPLDRDRPLWELYVVEGLAGGRVAVVTKTHHAAIDGASGAEMGANLLDLSAATTVFDEMPWEPEPVPSQAEMLAAAVPTMLRQPAQLISVIRETLGTARELRQREGFSLPVAPFSAPRTSLNAAITPHRGFGFTRVSLADIRTIRAEFGGTVNDVVLAVCAGALRAYLSRRGDLPAEPLVAMVPVSVRSEDQHGEPGNRITNMFVQLATDEADPGTRLRTITQATKTSKEVATAIGAEALSDWAEFAAPAVAARASRLYSSMHLANRHKPLFNLTISNVPGPNFDLFMAGARLEAWYPLGPIFDGGGLNMTVMSYKGVVHFGLLVCPELVPDPWELAGDVDAAAGELIALAGAWKAGPRSVGKKSVGKKQHVAKKSRVAKKPPAKKPPAAKSAVKKPPAEKPAAKRPAGAATAGSKHAPRSVSRVAPSARLGIATSARPRSARPKT